MKSPFVPDDQKPPDSCTGLSAEPVKPGGDVHPAKGDAAGLQTPYDIPLGTVPE